MWISIFSTHLDHVNTPRGPQSYGRIVPLLDTILTVVKLAQNLVKVAVENRSDSNVSWQPGRAHQE